MLDNLFQAFRNSGGLTIRPGVVRSSDHLQIRSGKLKIKNCQKACLSDKSFDFSLALILHLSNSAIGKSFKSARARNSRQQFKPANQRRAFSMYELKYVGTIN